MAYATFVQDGCSIDYVPTAAVAAGDIVDVGGLIGIAKLPIAANVRGALSLEGVFEAVKDGTSGPVFAIGDSVYWDSTNLLAVRTGGILLGPCIEAAGASDASVRFKLDPLAAAPALEGKIWEDNSLASGSKTLDAEDVGKVINITTGHATNVVTLPSTAIGLSYTIRVGTTGQRVAVSPAALDKFMGADLAGLDNKDRIDAAATSRQGDYISLVADGVNGWFVTSEQGIWTQEA